MKNHNSRLRHIEKYSLEEYCFPSLALATERGELVMKQGVYNAFNTMELNHFILTMTEKFDIGV